MKKINHVLIIGGGIAGLAVSLFLKKAGIQSTIFESKSSYDTTSGAGFLISANGVKVLNSLICEEDILANSNVIKSLHIFNEENEELIVQRNYLKKYYDAPMINIKRSILAGMLEKKIKEWGIKIYYNKKLTSLEQSSHGVTAFFEDGSTAEGELLIGADGTFSKTRTNIFPGAKLEYAGLWGVQGVTSINDPTLSNLGTKSYGYMGKNQFTLTIGKCHPTEDNDMLWQAFGFSMQKLPTKDFENANAFEIKNYLLSLMDEWKIPKEVVEMVRNTGEVFPSSIYNLPSIPSWSHGRVVLIGDALHTANPFVGQGTAFSLEDAKYLAKMLKEHDYRDAFYYFENDRRPRVQSIKEHFDKQFSLEADEIEVFINNYEISWDEEKVKN